MERRGFFGALMAVLALPFVRRKYPPVTRVPQYTVDHPKWKAKTCAPTRAAKEGTVFKFFLPADESRSPRDEAAWKMFIDSYYVADRKGEPLHDGHIPIYRFHVVDHRPTWSDVRQLLGKKG